MNATDYLIMLTWSKDDGAYLARVPHLPGCMADGRTQVEALKNAHFAIEEWLETAKEMGWEIPPPLDDATLEKQAIENNSEQMRHFQEEVKKEVAAALKQIVPKIIKDVMGQMPKAEIGSYFRPQTQPAGGKAVAASHKG